MVACYKRGEVNAEKDKHQRRKQWVEGLENVGKVDVQSRRTGSRFMLLKEESKGI